MDPRKVLRKTSKQALWILFALFTGFTFVAYFSPATELASRLASFSLGPWETFWTLFYGFATYGNAGYMREQVCKYMCPYARFQGAMFDPDTLIISYDEERGEPRGPRKRGIDHRAKGLGDCIDCKLCVQVCPTGIDIRDGLQYECIACAACVDACDSVMDKMGYPRGLVRYSSERGMEGKRTKVLRPRIFLYGTLLTILAAVFVTALAMRSPVGLDVLPERNPMFRESGFGDIENIYTLKVINKDSEPRTFEVEVSGLTGAELSLRPETVSVRPGGVQDIIATVTVNMEHLEDRTSDVYFTITRTDDESVSTTTRTRFHGPAR